ncbi:hypothetical protein K490DRAFT_70703 [Saccharata proteae CBS 121410]|uniref:P-loop containing nucleoside triphosphate hydrolase protein n=1 Tax=Saccharata proteae CBS 121410 TaxID=1314787 RepID=A0A9P4HZ75_9PEZI|nr:hypothetical protein K490DRAFT_70703 [Saccharata proteae CBS 121410]
MSFLQPSLAVSQSAQNGGISEEEKTTPLFSWSFKETYALLGYERVTKRRDGSSTAADPAEIIFLNTNTPWSAFLCGSQGSGKSYTLSCMLEGCLIPSKKIGKLPKPLTGIVFHYDTHSSNSICEAAWLSSPNIKVNVLVSLSNFHRLKALYSRIPAITVQPLKLRSKHLNVERMRDLMAFGPAERPPLYMQVLYGILREIAIQRPGGFDLADFSERVAQKEFTKDQQIPLALRLELLTGFMDKDPKKPAYDLFSPEPGTLTVVDLTDPFVDAGTACTMFDICLALFLENNNGAGLVVALDEAHKARPLKRHLCMQYMNNNPAAARFTDNLITTIRVQRHVASRIIIATQEPDIDPKLMDLCSMTIIHRFTSPAWYEVLRQHIAGLSKIAGNTKEETIAMFQEIVELNVGESLLFSPSAMLRVKDGVVQKLGFNFIRFKTRPRLTADGGRSVQAIRE